MFRNVYYQQLTASAKDIEGINQNHMVKWGYETPIYCFWGKWWWGMREMKWCMWHFIILLASSPLIYLLQTFSSRNSCFTSRTICSIFPPWPNEQLNKNCWMQNSDETTNVSQCYCSIKIRWKLITRCTQQEREPSISISTMRLSTRR